MYAYTENRPSGSWRRLATPASFVRAEYRTPAASSTDTSAARTGLPALSVTVTCNPPLAPPEPCAPTTTTTVALSASRPEVMVSVAVYSPGTA